MSVKVTKDKIVIREKLASITKVVNTGLVNFWFLGDAVVTSFILPIGFKPYSVYNAGARVKEGSADEYTVSYDGSVYSVVFAVAPANGNDICIDGVRA